MAARNTQGGTVLAGTLVVSATISAGVQKWAGEAKFAGTGAFAENATLLMQASALLAGVGNITADPALRMQASAAMAGAGNFAADGSTSRQPIQGTAAFVGAGSLVANTIHFSAGIYDETGAATLSISGNAFTELEFGLKLDYDNLTTGDVLDFRIYKDGSPLDSYLLTPSLTVPAHAISATAAFAGLGSLAVDSTVLRGALEGAAALIGSGNFTIVPTLTMLAQGTFVGVGSMVADLTKIVDIWQGEAIFSAAGAFSATAKFNLSALATFAGSGAVSFTGASIRIIIGRPPGEISDIFQGAGAFSAAAKLLAQASATFVGAGSLVVDTIQLGKIFASVAYLGSGSLIANTWQWMMAAGAFAGQGTASITPRLIMRTVATTYTASGSINIQPSLRMMARATYSGVGNQSALALLLCNVSAKYAGVGNMATTPRLLMNSGDVLFNGIGSLAAVTRQRMAVTGTFGGESNFDITAKLRMRAFASYSGEGSMVVDLTPPIMVWSGQATFAGAGTLSALGIFDLAGAVSMDAVGNLSVDTIRFINLSEQFFAGTGSLIVGDVQQVLGAFANYGGQGCLTVATMMTSARDYWLICSGITMQPEVLGDAAMAATVAGSFELTTPLDGKPAVREC